MRMVNPICENTAGPEPKLTLNTPYVVSEVIVAAAAVVANALVIMVFARERSLRTRTKYYIISLAVADLLVGLVGIPFAIIGSIGYPKQFHLCLFTICLLIILCTISILCLVAVSFDRYWAILYPLSYSRTVTSTTVFKIIMGCWVAGTGIGLLPLMGWNRGAENFRQCTFDCVMDHDYLVFIYIATIILPAVILTIFYAHIHAVVRCQLREIVRMVPGEKHPSISSEVMLRVQGPAKRREVRTTQNLIIIVLLFIVCWVPLYTYNAVQKFCTDCQIPVNLLYFFIVLSHLNSSFNPLVYACHLKDFRRAMKGVFGVKDEHVPKTSTKLKWTSGTHLEERTHAATNEVKFIVCNGENRENCREGENCVQCTQLLGN